MNGMVEGKIVQVIGSTLDAEYPREQAARDLRRAGRRHRDCTASLSSSRCEVQQHLGGNRVRAVALGSTDGLVRGMSIFNTGAPVTVPVGEPTLGRVFNLSGEPIDKKGPITVKERRADPPGAARVQGARAQDADLRDRHQGRRSPRALREGRKDRTLRRRRRRQDRHHPGAHPQHRRRCTAASPCSPAWASARARATTSGSKCRNPASSTRPRWSSGR